jgi:eukaryotic-like serine/threonine-protein kinase
MHVRTTGKLIILIPIAFLFGCSDSPFDPFADPLYEQRNSESDSLTDSDIISVKSGGDQADAHFGIDIRDLIEMAWIPEGPSWVGCDPSTPDPFGESCREDELPFHDVYLSNFLIDRTEVPFNKYRECVRAGICTPSRYDDSPLSGNRQPVIGVSRQDADTYCKWADKRLPTEAEWEKAARGPQGYIYPWGNQWNPEACNWDDNGLYDGYDMTAPVTSFRKGASPYGVLNMAGNVWEWVSDFYDPNYYASSPVLDPQGPDSGELSLLKGGAWKWDFWESKMRTFHRNSALGYGYSDHVGFRCAKDLDLW